VRCSTIAAIALRKLTFTVTIVFDFACGDGATIECNTDSNATRNPTNVATIAATSTQKIT